MRSQDFIGAVVSGRRTKPGCCSSIYFDGKHVYSYGTHYPLLINLDGRWILNTRGYSITTARHISWASRFADYSFRFPYGMNTSRWAIVEDVDRRIKELREQLPKLRKGAFRKQADMEHELSQLYRLQDFISVRLEPLPA